MDTRALAIVFIFCVSQVPIGLAGDSSYCVKNSSVHYAEQLVETYGTDGHINEAGLFQMIKDFQNSAHVDTLLGSCPEEEINCTQWKQECPSMVEGMLEDKGTERVINATGLISVFPLLVHSLTSGPCSARRLNGTKMSLKPTSGEMWGYGFGFVGFICFISNIGAVLGPIMNRPFFKRVLSMFVSVAIGTLTSTGLMVLIPESLDIMGCPEQANEYLWKAATAVVSVYVFYLSERFIKIAFYRRDVRKMKKSNSYSIDVKAPLNGPDGVKTNMNDSIVPKMNDVANEHGHSHFNPERVDEDGNKIILTVGWMVLAGDALHNFVDGLSIGAAFTQNIYTGISVSIAIICEELPHELGDIAILLHSGFSMKRALLYNFLAALTCVMGLVLGIVLGETTTASRWIFAIAGGLFLYVPLVDMLPEMSAMLDEEMNKKDGKVWTFLCVQIVGLLIGTTIILVVAHFASSINLQY